MMSGGFCIVTFVVTVALFYALVPGVLLTLPGGNSSRVTTTLVHAAIFALVSQVVHKLMKSVMGPRHGTHAVAPPPIPGAPPVKMQ